MQNLVEKVKNHSLIMDGAMGTILQSAGLPKNTSSNLWTLEKPDEIIKVHRNYLNAGSELLLTNTFGASSNRLLDSKINSSVKEVNRKAVQILSEAVGGKAFKGGSIGPIGTKDIPFEKLSRREAEFIYAEQIDALAGEDVDTLVFETMLSLKEIECALSVARDIVSNHLPLFLFVTVDNAGNLFSGENLQSACRLSEEFEVSVFGVNCSHGPSSVLNAFSGIKTSLPLAAKPNAGVNNRASPDEFFLGMQALIKTGIRIIGGCCGTTPEYISKLAIMVKD